MYSVNDKFNFLHRVLSFPKPGCLYSLIIIINGYKVPEIKHMAYKAGYPHFEKYSKDFMFIFLKTL